MHVSGDENSYAFDIYTTTAQTGDTKTLKRKAVPFVHNIAVKSTNGELVRVRALFDDGAMVNAMCTTVFDTIKHRLRGWTTNCQTLRMANGTIIPAVAQWTGTVCVDNAEVQATFIVFNSGGGWAFLLGKPLLQALKAKHDYDADQITVTDGRSTTTL
ncbi:hypothetical protein BKA83DRAFT_116441, partial [Pisolithus microcarpus]